MRGAGELGQRGQVVDAVVLDRSLGFAGRVDHADGPTHDGHGNAQSGKTTLRPVAQLGTGVEVVTVGEHLNLRPPGGRAAVR